MSPAHPAAATVAFPAAAGIRPTTQPVGPEQVGPIFNAVGTALVPNDLVAFDDNYTGTVGGTPNGNVNNGAILNLAVHGNSTTGTQSVLASSSVGSGVTYGEKTSGGLDNGIGATIAVSPAGLVYYFKAHELTAGGPDYQDFVEINPVTGVRRVISDGSNSALGPVTVTVDDICYDYSTGTLLYYDSENGNTSTRGIFRVNIGTGVRTAVSLNTNSPGSGTAFVSPNSFSTDPFGNIFYIDFTSGSASEPTLVLEIPVTADASATYGARKVISTNSSPNGSTNPFNYLLTTQFDSTQTVTLSGGLPTNESLIVTDQGDDQSSSDIFRIATSTGAHTDLLNTTSNTGGATFDDPQDAQIDTTGRIYFNELHNYISNGSTTDTNTVNFIPVGTRTDTILSGDQDFGPQETVLRIVPPPTPTLNAGTTSNVLGTTATLNGNVTADGGVTNSGIFQRGFVYASTSTNSAPKVGGTGVTQVSTLALTSLPATQGQNLGAFTANLTGLTAGTSYTFSAYARNISGFTYTAPITFTTATAPAISSPTATNISGTSATLGGNVTSNGGAALTARGVVYSPTATNSNPVIGATGVTNLTDASATTGVFTDPTGNALSSGTTYSFRAYATNAVGTSYSAASTFTTIAPPTANSQSVTTAFNTAKAITLTGSDPNSPAQTLTYNVTVQPVHGTLSGTAPNLTYTPTTGFNGTDTFQFTTTNTSGLTSSAATVSIRVVGQPYVTGFTPASGPVGTTLTIMGSQFTGATGVTLFRNVAGTNFTLVSDTQITVTVPAGTTTGILRVNTASGSGASSTKFVVTVP